MGKRNGTTDDSKAGEMRDAAAAMFANVPTAEDMASGKIKVISYIERKTGGLVFLWSDKEEDADPSEEMIERLNHKTIAIYKLYKVINADRTFPFVLPED